MSGVIGALNSAAASWWPYMFHAAWQGAAVGVIALLAVWALRRRSAPLRYGVLLVALAKFAIPPMLALPTGLFFWLPEPARIETAVGMAEVTLLPDSAESLSDESAPAANESIAMLPGTWGNLEASSAETMGSPVPSTRLTWRGWLLVAHVAGAVLMAGWLLYALTRLRRTLSRCYPVWEGPLRESARRLSQALGMRGDTEILLARENVAPMAVGMFRPSVVLPESMAETLSPEELEVVLAHELAHLRRRDPIVLALENVLLSLWWFNPVLWLVVRALRKSREDCCDDLALSLNLADEHTYCRSLVNAASTVARPVWSPAILGFADRMHPLGRRLTRLMDTTLRKPHRLSLAGMAVLALLAIVVLPGLRMAAAGPSGSTETAAVSTQAVVSAAQPSAVEGAPGKLIFHGKYRHRSRGHDIPEPGELWLKETEPGAVTAIVHLPFMNSTEIAKGGEANQIIEYRTVREPEGDNPGYRIDLDIQNGQVMVTRRNVREDWDGKALPVPEGALFDPNSRPDPYAAANIILRGLNLKEGERKELRVYDWDNSGNAMAAYVISFTNAGKEGVIVPAGRFEATHIVLEQVTSADTWFKKRAGHVTDFWMLDNGVIVRVVRHREPYELELLEWSAPETLPGYAGPAEAAVSLQEAKPETGQEVMPLPPAPAHENIPGEVTFKGVYKHFSRGSETGTAEVVYKETPGGGLGVWSHLDFYPSTYVAMADSTMQLEKYILHHSVGGRPGYHAEYGFAHGSMKGVKMPEGASPTEVALDLPVGAVFDPNTRPDPYCVAPIILRALDLKEGQSRELDVYDTDETGEGVDGYRIRFEHKGEVRLKPSEGVGWYFRANHIVLTQLSSARTWFKKRGGHVTEFWVLDNGVIVRILRHREPYEIRLVDWSVPGQSPDSMPGLLGRFELDASENK